MPTCRVLSAEFVIRGVPIARSVSESLEAIQIKLKPGYFANLFTDIAELLQTPVELSGEFTVGLAKIAAKTKDSPKLRSQLRQYLEPRTNGILEAINKEILAPATERLKQQGKKGLVVIIDNLDRLDNSPKPTGSRQPEYLFVDRGEQLNQLNCHVVYTVLDFGQKPSCSPTPWANQSPKTL